MMNLVTTKAVMHVNSIEENTAMEDSNTICDQIKSEAMFQLICSHECKSICVCDRRSFESTDKDNL